jgi:hypothetical protein
MAAWQEKHSSFHAQSCITPRQACPMRDALGARLAHDTEGNSLAVRKRPSWRRLRDVGRLPEGLWHKRRILRPQA